MKSEDVVEYHVVEAGDVKSLASMVKAQLDGGWQIWGDLQVKTYAYQDDDLVRFHYCQVMVR